VLTLDSRARVNRYSWFVRPIHDRSKPARSSDAMATRVRSQPMAGRKWWNSTNTCSTPSSQLFAVACAMTSYSAPSMSILSTLIRKPPIARRAPSSVMHGTSIACPACGWYPA
jgi:hypothetical protein